MKILKLSPYYEPEQVSDAHLTADLEKAWIDSGAEIVNYVPIPTRGITKDIRKKYYRERCEKKYNSKIKINRFWMFEEGKNTLMRTVRYLLVGCIQYWKGIHEKNVDVIFSSSTPPTQGLMCALVAKKLSKKNKKKVRFIYNLQDIFPDSMINVGMTHKGSLLWKIGRKIEDFTYSKADKIIVISVGFKKNIMEKGVPEEKIEIVSNWIDLDVVYPIERKNNRLISELGINSEKFTVVYAGNFGAAQGADIILKAAAKLEGNKDIQFVIFGGGVFFEDARMKAKNLKNVFIYNLMPQNRISEVYSLGDVALIVCKAGTGMSGMPSKMWSIMACNTPIIASFDINSDLANVIKVSGAGICVEPENVDQLCDAILEKYNNNNENYTFRKYVEQNASKEICVNKYIRILKEYN